MSKLIGKRAVVVGAGIGGLTAARVLADHFEHVLILERDVLPAEPEDRPGVPQGRHVHGLLRGGQDALEALLPGFERDLAAGGAVLLRAGLDLRIERPGFDSFPAARCRLRLLRDVAPAAGSDGAPAAGEVVPQRRDP